MEEHEVRLGVARSKAETQARPRGETTRDLWKIRVFFLALEYKKMDFLFEKKLSKAPSMKVWLFVSFFVVENDLVSWKTQKARPFFFV